MKGVLIAGTNSGCGKTTLTIGLMALLKSMGKKVTPFKTGPDYIDPLFHGRVLETPSYNLDTFLMPEETIKHLFYNHSKQKDIAVVEGVMGMYDGMGSDAVGSSYELSQMLSIPVVLVVSCKSLYQSVAAIVKGFSTFKSDANIKGVILNHVPTEEYYKFLKSVIEKETGIACLGFVPSDSDFSLESRHLGLVQAEEVNQLPAIINKLIQTLKKTIDVQQLLEIAEMDSRPNSTWTPPVTDLSDLHIGVASDKAFRFYYRDNLELLESLGAKLSYFSPLESADIPADCNCLYIGGGYPEVFATELAKNTGLLKKIKEAVDEGMPVYAECGGLMYLCTEIIDIEGQRNKMTGVYNASVQMTERLQRFGYATIIYKGTNVRCHEFHRSTIINTSTPNYTLEYDLQKPEKQKHWQCGLLHKNSLAAYAHVHFYSNLQFLDQIIQLWRRKTI